MTVISNENRFPELAQDVIDVLAENGYTLVKRISPPEADAFDPTDGGKKVIEPDDDFGDEELPTPQVCNLAECESCT